METVFGISLLSADLVGIGTVVDGSLGMLQSIGGSTSQSSALIVRGRPRIMAIRLFPGEKLNLKWYEDAPYLSQMKRFIHIRL